MLDRFVLRYWLGADCSHICDKFVMKCGLFIYVWQVLLHCGLSECVSLVCIKVLTAHIYRVSHELRSLLRESVPYVKIYRYNPKHLYPKLNSYGDNGKRSLKV